jgi:hypothetical protein
MTGAGLSTCSTVLGRTSLWLRTIDQQSEPPFSSALRRSHRPSPFIPFHSETPKKIKRAPNLLTDKQKTSDKKEGSQEKQIKRASEPCELHSYVRYTCITALIPSHAHARDVNVCRAIIITSSSSSPSYAYGPPRHHPVFVPGHSITIAFTFHMYRSARVSFSLRGEERE